MDNEIGVHYLYYLRLTPSCPLGYVTNTRDFADALRSQVLGANNRYSGGFGRAGSWFTVASSVYSYGKYASKASEIGFNQQRNEYETNTKTSIQGEISEMVDAALSSLTACMTK